MRLTITFCFKRIGSWQILMRKYVGLNDFPADEIPPLWIHYTFDAMVGIGMYLTIIPLLFFLAYLASEWEPLQ